MDLQRCLEILGNRGTCGHVHHAAEGQGEEPCGQVIQLVSDVAPAAAGQDDQPPAELARQSVEEMMEGMKEMDVAALVQAFKRAQEERVAAYRTYEKGLGEVLASRRLDHYTAVCTAATASFAALSNLINAVEGSLRRPAHAGVAAAGAVAGIVRKVQLEEKEKLQLTAALHLERLRLCEAGGGQGQDQGLLREGVKRLEGRVAAVNGRINELLEEVMYEMEGL